jgi:hypothetical protein
MKEPDGDRKEKRRPLAGVLHARGEDLQCTQTAVGGLLDELSGGHTRRYLDDEGAHMLLEQEGEFFVMVDEGWVRDQRGLDELQTQRSCHFCEAFQPMGGFAVCE